MRRLPRARDPPKKGAAQPAVLEMPGAYPGVGGSLNEVIERVISSIGRAADS